MKKSLAFLAAFCGLCAATVLPACADSFYPAAAIPETLKANAYAVVRLHETTFMVKSLGEAVEKVHTVVTVLNEKGAGAGRLHVFYDKLVHVNALEGTLYDAGGKVLKRLKKADITDRSQMDDTQLFVDDRVKTAEFAWAQYPYTVEFSYETTNRRLLFYPVWDVVRDNEISVEKATFVVEMPAGLELRYREKHLPKGVAVAALPDGKRYAWELARLPAFEWDAYNPPTVITAATDFELEGQRGSLRTWADIGMFFYKLNQGRDELPEAARQNVLRLVAAEKEPAAKVKKLYEHLQASTRYVGVQVGVGGWQTIPAATVAQVGYGDCKALTNYMKAMLKVAGIPAFVGAVNAGPYEPEVMVDFPNPYFNHVILCVPLPKDTVWLECTSQNGAFGYQGGSTGNRYSLLETPAGGKLVRTTTYTATHNRQLRRAAVTLTEQGDAAAEVTTRYTGQQQDEIRKIMHGMTAEDQRKALYKQIAIPSFEIVRHSFAEEKNRLPAITETLALTVRKCGSRSGTRMFVTPNLMNAVSAAAPAANRQTEWDISQAFQDVDTVTYRLPKGYGVEFMPEPVRLESRFGSYQAATEQAQEGEIRYVRRFTIHRGHHPAGIFNEWAEFTKKVAKADRTQMVLVNKGL